MGFRLRFLIVLASLGSVPSFAAESPPVAPAFPPNNALSGDLYSMVSGMGRGSLQAPLQPADERSLAARAAGIVEVIHAPEGSLVTAGQAIMTLDSNQERADVSQAQASVHGAKAEMDRAAAEYDRTQKLREDAINSEKQLQDAKANAEIAQSRYEQAVAALDAAKVRLAYRDIVSPINGIFLKTNKHVGEAVERNETVVRVVDVSSLEMVVYCDARYFSLFKVGQKVDVRVLIAADNQPIVPGTVFYVDPIVDSTSTFRVKVKIEPSAQAVAGFQAILIAPDR